MATIQSYSDKAVRMLYEQLIAKQRNGIDFDYEVRFDNEPIVPRSKNLDDFYGYVPLLNEYTRSIEVLVYLGASRRYTKYVFTIEDHVPQQNDIEERIREGVEKKMRQLESEAELNRLYKKVKDQKEIIKEYRHRVEKLESSGFSGFDNLMGMLKSTGLVEKFINGQTTTPLSGTSEPNNLNQQMLVVLNELQAKLGDPTYQRLLGVSLLLSEHPQLIEEVEKFINQHNQKLAS